MKRGVVAPADDENMEVVVGGGEPDETLELKRARPSLSPPPTIRGPPCQVCQEKEQLYCCPRCSIKTCSLTCCKLHKQQSGCSGQRDRTGSCALRDFSDCQLRSDYLFLEEIINSAQAARRTLLQQQQAEALDQPKKASKRKWSRGRGLREARPSSLEEAMGLPMDWVSKFPPHLQKLVNQARRRRVNLVLMPLGMSKRLRNTSRYVGQEDKIYWRIEWDFPDAVVPVHLKEDCYDETLPLAKALSQHLDPHTGNAPTRQSLKPYCQVDRREVMMVMEVIPRPSNQPAYAKLDPQLPLKALLAGKNVVEFLTIHVVLPSSSGGRFPLLIEEVARAGDQMDTHTPADDEEIGGEGKAIAAAAMEGDQVAVARAPS